MNKAYNQIIPRDAVYIIEELEKNGYEAYIVGGCVRDLLMQRTPNDWDITTSATPDQVKAIFKRTYDTGLAHGTVTVIVDEEHFEVTTYRIEGDYKDARRPESVAFVEDITQDLARRDFTMNAIAYHPQRGFVDPYNGREAISKRCIVTVRDAKERFGEDALRLLRAVRFSAQLGFHIQEDTVEAIKACAPLLQKISKERIRDELIKICISPRPEAIHTLYTLGLLQWIIPEWLPLYATPQNHPHHSYDVAHHSIEAMRHTPQDTVLRLTMLLHDIAKPSTRTTDEKGIDHFYNHPQKGVPIAKKILKDLRLDNQTINDVSKLIAYHDWHLKQKLTPQVIKELLCVLELPLFDKLLLVNEADARAQNPQKLPKKLQYIQEAKAIKEKIIQCNECYNLKMLAITGKDLIDLGIPKGKKIGEHLQEALAYVIKHPSANTKEQLVTYLRTKGNL